MKKNLLKALALLLIVASYAAYIVFDPIDKLFPNEPFLRVLTPAQVRSIELWDTYTFAAQIITRHPFTLSVNDEESTVFLYSDDLLAILVSVPKDRNDEELSFMIVSSKEGGIVKDAILMLDTYYIDPQDVIERHVQGNHNPAYNLHLSEIAEEAETFFNCGAFTTSSYERAIQALLNKQFRQNTAFVQHFARPLGFYCRNQL